MMGRQPFKKWLATVRAADNPVGDWIRDARRTRSLKAMPDDFKTIHDLRTYMRRAGGLPCQEAYEAGWYVWEKYLKSQGEKTVRAYAYRATGWAFLCRPCRQVHVHDSGCAGYVRVSSCCTSEDSPIYESEIEPIIIGDVDDWRELERISQRRQIGLKRRFEILRRDDFRCRTCGASADDGTTLHVDHIHPVAKGGSNDPDNLWTLCQECNLGKGTMELGT